MFLVCLQFAFIQQRINSLVTSALSCNYNLPGLKPMDAQAKTGLNERFDKLIEFKGDDVPEDNNTESSSVAPALYLFALLLIHLRKTVDHKQILSLREKRKVSLQYEPQCRPNSGGVTHETYHLSLKAR